ncbi:MAG: hypothetical protein II719_02735 [Clostridia bacterium]|nr:hypothetical protein [Clostridia bacterium]
MPVFQFESRTFDYSGLPLPARVRVGKKDLLAAPARLVLRDGAGTLLSFETGDPLFVRREAHGEVWSFSGCCEEAKLIFGATLRAEDDGFLWCDLTLVPRWYKTPSFGSLALEIPLRAEFCRLLHAASLEAQLPAWASGTFPEAGGSLPFVPTCWIGREDAGFCVSMESAKGVLLRNPKAMFDLIPQGDSVLLRIRLLDRLPAHWEEDNPPLVFSFGIQATPVKPYRHVPEMDRALHVSLESLSNPLFEKIAEQGIRTVIFHENWTSIQNYGLPESGSEIRRQVERCHRMGLLALAYYGYEFATNAPDFSRKWEEWLVRQPDGKLRGGYERLNPPQRDFIVCFRSGYAKEMQERVRLTLEEYGFDGIYTDGTFLVFPCSNEKHGCGWRDGEGKLHPTFPILAWREHLRTLYEITREHGGIFDSHNGGQCFPALYAWTDTILDGEAIQEDFFRNVDGFITSGLARAQFTGANFGVPVQFVIYHDELIDPLLVCGIPGRYFGFGGVERASKLWAELDAFGTDGARFLPPWDESGTLSVTGDRLFASCWIREEDGREKALCAVYNSSDGEKTATVRCLGRTAEVAAPPKRTVFVTL